jgi:hypothetical protein
MTPQSALSSKIKKLTVIQQNTVGCRLIFLTEILFQFMVILMLDNAIKITVKSKDNFKCFFLIHPYD